MKKIISFLIVISIIAGGYYVYTEYIDKTDDEKIEDCLNDFAQAYGDGDMEACLKCYVPRRRNAMKGTNDLASSFFNFSNKLMPNLFSIGVDRYDLEIKFTIKKINYKDERHADVTAELWESNGSWEPWLFDSETTNTITIKMEKNKNKWYIADGV